jgi:hypothetical protein
MKEYPDRQFYIITVKNTEIEEELTLKCNWDSNIQDWIASFKTILFWATFDPETIKEAFGEEEE